MDLLTIYKCFNGMCSMSGWNRQLYCVIDKKAAAKSQFEIGFEQIRQQLSV